jgi:formate-dependent nitrite reductase cytochrome c552 subunit
MSAFAILATAAEEKKAALPALKIDMSSPLLLEAPGETADKEVHKADNSACYVCHANYQEEELVGWHAVEDTGCVDCHGDSFAHRNDENNTTPPDVMFPANKIDANCAECHEEHDVPADKIIARFLERCPEKNDPKTLVCTDCHGQHRLKLRTVVWNKETRELITGKAKLTEESTSSSGSADEAGR